MKRKQLKKIKYKLACRDCGQSVAESVSFAYQENDSQFLPLPYAYILDRSRNNKRCSCGGYYNWPINKKVSDLIFAQYERIRNGVRKRFCQVTSKTPGTVQIKGNLYYVTNCPEARCDALLFLRYSDLRCQPQNYSCYCKGIKFCASKKMGSAIVNKIPKDE